MKNILIHSVSVVISFIWLVTELQMLNPIFLKGPDFLKFYLILLLCFYVSVVILRLLKKTFTKATIYFMGFIFILGFVKLIRGIILGKPIGFLMLILIMEIIGTIFFILLQSKPKSRIN